VAKLATHRHHHAHDIVHQLAVAAVVGLAHGDTAGHGPGLAAPLGAAAHASPFSILVVAITSLQAFVVDEAAFFSDAHAASRQELASTTAKKVLPLDT
jgi:hypothetical protein